MTECLEGQAQQSSPQPESGATMNVIQMAVAGPPEVLRTATIERPRIELGSDVLIRIKAAGVNPIDTKIRNRGLFFPDGLPAVLGLDGAGIIEDVGIAVSRFKPGDTVWFCHGGLGREQGNYAQYTVLEESLARFKPVAMDFVESAACPLALITAWEALFDRARLEAGQTVLIHGAAGGVGHLAVQLARIRGAKVCATVSSESKADFVRTLGAEHVIQYNDENFVDAVHEWTHGHGVDVALDTVGGKVFRDTINAMANYGHLVTLLDPGSDLNCQQARKRNLTIGFELMLTPMLEDLPVQRKHQGEILDQCAEWIGSGKLKVRVAQTYPLAQAAYAHEAIEQGHTQGKIVLTVE